MLFKELLSEHQCQGAAQFVYNDIHVPSKGKELQEYGQDAFLFSFCLILVTSKMPHCQNNASYFRPVSLRRLNRAGIPSL